MFLGDMTETINQYAKELGWLCKIEGEGTGRFYVLFDENGEEVFRSQVAEEIGAAIDREKIFRKFQ